MSGTGISGSRASNQQNSTPNTISGWLQEQKLLANHVAYTSPTASEYSSYSRNEESSRPRRAQEDIIIAVTGTTGCGKSSFISKLAPAARDDTSVDDFTPENPFMREIEGTIQGHRVLFINTPDTTTTGKEEKVLKHIKAWLHHSYAGKKFLSGLIHIQGAQETPRNRPVKILKLYRKVTGRGNMKSVVLATPQQNNLNENQFNAIPSETRLRQSNFGKVMIAGGATVTEYDGTADSAERIVLELLAKTCCVSNISNQPTESRFERDGRDITTITIMAAIITITAFIHVAVIATTEAVATTRLTTILAAIIQIISVIALLSRRITGVWPMVTWRTTEPEPLLNHQPVLAGPLVTSLPAETSNGINNHVECIHGVPRP